MFEPLNGPSFTFTLDPPVTSSDQRVWFLRSRKTAQMAELEPPAVGGVGSPGSSPPSAYRAPPLQSQSAGAQGKVGAGAQDYPPPASCRGLSGCGGRGRCRWLPGKASASTWGTCEEPRGKGSPSGGQSMARGTARGVHGSSFPLGEPSAWSMRTRSLSCHTADALGHALPRPLPARD